MSCTSAITLKGSADIICKFIEFAVNSILFRRGVYPDEQFMATKCYLGLAVLILQDKRIEEYMSTILSQLKEWLVERIVNKVALVITDVKTFEIVERWEFYVECEGDMKDFSQTSDKPLMPIRDEIRSILMQIATSATSLPRLKSFCSFDIQIYTKNNVSLPKHWGDVEHVDIKNAQCMKMAAFTTDIHIMETAVVYKKVN